MAIKNMILGDKNIVRAYKNNEIVFERSTPYIQRIDDYTGSDPAYSKTTYIHIDDVELMYNWTYEADVEGLSSNPQSRLWCFLGGSFEYNTTDYWLYPHLDGIFFGYKEYNGVKETLAAQDKIDQIYQPHTDQAATIGERHVVTMKLNSLPPNHYGDNIYQGTLGGFHILAAMVGINQTIGYVDYQAGDAINEYLGAGSFYKNKGKIYRISLYDENDVLIHNYLPRVVDGHKGMYDTVINKFYPCSDDSKFIIAND